MDLLLNFFENHSPEIVLFVLMLILFLFFRTKKRKRK